MPLITVLHKQRCLEQQAGKDALANRSGVPVRNDKTTHSYQVALTALAQIREQLGALDDIRDKVALKAKVLPQFTEFLQDYRDSGQRYPNQVLVFCIIWLLDVEDIESAMAWAGLAIEQQQLMPEFFKRDLPTYVLEEIHDWAERQYKAGHSASPYLEQAADLMTAGTWPTTNSIVMGKVYRLCGMHAERGQELKAALDYFEQAQAANEAAGCKTRIKQLKAQLGLE
ncbi:phage terminase small subunit [Hahella ganghwensis]|uniref:phage terminase small subunit n=1 Tax=Hahella ganghwensis TaxID=286420 RepID=UPI000373DF8E|nr:phage terminase small subunit [Hahella ganghwensis]